MTASRGPPWVPDPHCLTEMAGVIRVFVSSEFRAMGPEMLP